MYREFDVELDALTDLGASVDKHLGLLDEEEASRLAEHAERALAAASIEMDLNLDHEPSWKGMR